MEVSWIRYYHGVLKALENHKIFLEVGSAFHISTKNVIYKMQIK